MRKHNLKRIYRIRFTSIRIFFGFPENGQMQAVPLRQRKYTLDILCSQADSGSNIIPMIFHRKNTRQCPIPLNKLIPFHVQNTVLHMYGNPSCRLLILPVFRFPAYRLALKKMICGKLVSWIFLAVLR